jgi:hypothetical protein
MQQDHMQFILEHVLPRTLLMKPGEETTCKDRFDPELWKAVPPFERRYIFGRPIAMLVAQGLLPLEFAGFNSKRHNLYRKK